MISFTSYIKNTFYNDIYKASETYFLEHLEDLGVLDNDDDEVEVTDIEVKYVYAGNREDDEIDIDSLTNVYATVFVILLMKKIAGFVYHVSENLMQESKILELKRLIFTKKEPIAFLRIHFRMSLFLLFGKTIWINLLKRY